MILYDENDTRPVAQLVACLTEEPQITGLIPGLARTFMEIDHEILSMVIFCLPLIQEGSCHILGKVWYFSTG